MADDKPSLREEYETFLRIVSTTIDLQIWTLGSQELREQAFEFKGFGFSVLTTTKSVDVVFSAINSEDDIIRDALWSEMRFYNIRYGYLLELTPDSERRADPIELYRASAGAETVKGSLEGILDLPDWIRKVLKALNELLSLLRLS